MEASRHRSFVKPCPVPPQRRVLERLTMNVAVAGTGRPVVFIHGIGWDHSLWGGAMARWSDRYLTIAGDICGHGDTDKPEGPYSVGGFAQDWAQLIAAITDKPVLIVGFSLGGMIAQTLALEYPALVGALVLANTSCRSPAVGSAHMQERLVTAREKGPAAAAQLAAKSVFSESWREANPAKLADFVDWRIGQDHRGLAAAMHAASNFDVSDRVSLIDVPTLVVTALGDELMLPADQRPLVELIHGAEYVEVVDSGHMVPIEQSEAFELALESFMLRKWPASGSPRNERPAEGGQDNHDPGALEAAQGGKKDTTR